MEAFRKTHKAGHSLVRPAAPAQNGDGFFGGPEHFLQLGHLCLAGPCFNRLDPLRNGRVADIQQHVFGQADDNRAGPSLHGDVIGARNGFRDAGRIIDFNHPFGG